MPPKKSKEDLAKEELLKQQQESFNDALSHSQGKIYPNMDNLPVLTEDYVLANLHNLYHKEQPTNPSIPHNYSSIYSQVGPILIALNPFKRLDCYNEEWQEAFHTMGELGNTEVAWRTLGPHCFCTIETAYQALKRTGRNQAVVICGESGAGKTWTCKLMLDYLCDMAVARHRKTSRLMEDMGSIHGESEKYTEKSAEAKAAQDEEAQRKERLEKCNVVLEAFGNAKTQRNDNSSRFGKFSQLFFDEVYAVQGCNFDHYLLERSRVVHVPDGERNYHIVHYLAKDEEAKCGAKFRYLSNAMNVQRASEIELEGGRKSRTFDDEGDFKQLKADMEKACFPLDVQEVVYSVFKGCMYLGNVLFEGDEHAGQLQAGSEKDLQTAMSLLGLSNQDDFVFALTHKEIKVAKDITIVQLDGGHSNTQRDNLAKTIYSRLFDWLIAQMNKAMGGLQSQYDTIGTVGLLDIFGFEDLTPNGFEQMFINLTNERIQHHFNNIMFHSEMKLYAEEGIEVTFEKPDNSAAILLFTAPKNSVISFLTECVHSKKDVDGDKFRELLDKTVSDKNKGVYVQIDMKSPTDPRDGFKVMHYAGQITYRCQGFIEKSKDACAMWLIEQLGKSTLAVPPNPRTKQSEPVVLMKELFPEELERLAAGDRDSSSSHTVGSTFRTQLASLMNTKLGAYDPIFGQRPPEQDPRVDSVFVRCIKPRANSMATFDHALVRQQLVTGGVMAALNIRERGMPDRMEYEEFLVEFWPLEARCHNDSTLSKPQRCKAILGLFYDEFTHAGEPRYKCGNTKVFMKSGILISLREIVDIVIHRCAKVVMRKWRARTGLDMLSDLNQMRGRIEALQVEAETYRVTSVSAVASGIQTCFSEVDKAFEVLGLDGENFEITKRALEKREKGTALRRSSEMAISNRIGYGGAFSKADMTRLSQRVEDARAKVLEVVNNRKAATDKVDSLLIPKFQQIDALVARIDEVLHYCKQTDPPERGGDLWKSCQEDKEKLGRIVHEEFRELARETVDAVDLNKKDPQIVLPPKADELVSKAEAIVSATEQAGAALIVQRKHFEFEQVRASPELQALQQQLEHARERVEILGADLDQARRQGLVQITDILGRAMEAERHIEEVLREALNADRYRQAIEEYLAAERELQEAVELMKKLEAEKAERERKSRRKIYDGFDKSRELLQVYFEFVNHIEKFQDHLDDTSAKAEVDGLTNSKANIEALKEKVQLALESMEEMQVESMVEKQAGEKIRFNYRGDWSPECFKLLGPELEPWKDLGPAIDAERCTDVVDAVELLNSGLLPMDEGFCIGWSKTWKQYYLLFQKAKEEEAITRLNRTRLEIETQERLRKRRAVQEAVKGALQALAPGELAAAVQRDQAALEGRIREHMRGELEEGFQERAKAEVEQKTEAVRKEVGLQVEAAEQQLQEALAEKLAAESGFQARVEELTAELQKCQVQTGVKGLVPSLHKQLSDVNTYCQGLQQSILKLKDLTVSELAGIEEALAYMDALTNNPRTLPGLRDFVKVLGTLQVSHTHSESICHQLGLEGQLSALNEARDQMAEAAGKVKRICEGQVSYGKGLEEELSMLRADLRICSKSFDMLRRVFETWESRLLQASGFIDKALDCLNTKLEKVPHLQENPRPAKRSGMWDRVFAGVMDNFCTANREPKKGTPRVPASLRLLGSAKRPVPPGHDPDHRPWNEPSMYEARRPKYHIEVGDYVQDTATARHRGIVRFVGKTSFASGEWVGIELEGPHGRNDGSVNGKRYFNCPPDFGIFLRTGALLKIGRQGGRALQLPRGYTSNPELPPGESAPVPRLAC